MVMNEITNDELQMFKPVIMQDVAGCVEHSVFSRVGRVHEIVFAHERLWWVYDLLC